MTGLFIGLYAIYLIAVGVQGNGATLFSNLKTDMPGYVPWLLAIIAIAIMAQSETLEKLVKPFIVLLILTFVLKNFPTIKTQISSIYNLSNQAVKNA